MMRDWAVKYTTATLHGTTVPVQLTATLAIPIGSVGDCRGSPAEQSKPDARMSY